MKKGIKLTVAVVIALVAFYIFCGTAILSFTTNNVQVADSIFTQTHWKQKGGFERLTPDSLRLGCWSTALAQIMYYHRLKPFGHIAYTSTKGYKIDEYIDSTMIDFGDLSLSIDSTTPEKNVEALAHYNYYAALAVHKDFGTDNYMQKLASSNLLEQHYKVSVNRYISWQQILPYSSGKLEQIICTEIADNRPLFLHFANLKNFGHSVVIDGYKKVSDCFMVHLNQGQGGEGDGWYDFDKDILMKGDRALRVIYAFRRQ